MHKTLFAIAAIIACSGYFVQSLNSAHAIPTGPSVELGEQPWRSFSGEVEDAYIALVEVPADRVFIVTTFVAHEYINAYQDSTLKLEGNTNAGSSGGAHNKALSVGNGHMVFEPGSTFQIRNAHTPSDYAYYIEGYFARP